ncbi:MAG: sulfotransferase [Pseudomonadota bacterium]
MKAGTTWLYRQLEQHPDIVFSREKELHYHAYRDGDIEAMNRGYRLGRARNAIERYEGSRLSPQYALMRAWYFDYVYRSPDHNRWYRRRFPRKISSTQYCADFSNLTATIREEHWQRLRELSSELKVTYLMRHPVGRIWSHLRFLDALGTDVTDGGQLSQPGALTKETIVELDQRFGLWRHSEYSTTIAILRRQLPAENIKLMFYDDIQQRPKELLQDLESFLELEHWQYHDNRMNRRINASEKQVPPPEVFQVFGARLGPELEALQRLGVTPPDAWGVQASSK